MNAPFEIGDVYWLASGTPRNETVPCPVCAGNKRFDVILGSGEQLSVECDGCGHGFDGPRGYINEWLCDPTVKRFEIARVETYRAALESMAEEWRVVSADGDAAYFSDLYETDAEAMEKATAEAKAIQDRALGAHQRKRKDTSKAGWSVRYHREQIKDLERRLAWHRAKIEAKR